MAKPSPKSKKPKNSPKNAKLVRFDFAPGASEKEIVDGILALMQSIKKKAKK